MSGEDSKDLTQVLKLASRGEAGAAAELIPRVYDRLREVAAAHLRRAARDDSLQPTELVHEAYLRLVDQSKVDWKGRTHFLAVAAMEMRRILIDHNRARKAAKRGGDRIRVAFFDEVLAEEGREVDSLDLENALEELSKLHPRQAKMVELRFLGGMNIEEVAEALGVSPKTIEKDWRMARAWLYRRLKTKTNP